MDAVLEVGLRASSVLALGDVDRRVQVVVGVQIVLDLVLLQVDLGSWSGLDLLTGNVNVDMGCGVFLGRSKKGG